MSIVVQFPDVTEYYYQYDMSPKASEAVKTEFAFNLGAFRNHSAEAEDIGLKPVSTMMNWWPTHAGEIRPLTLFWGRAIYDNGIPQPTNRTYWRFARQDPVWNKIVFDLAASGCGLKIAEPPLKKEKFHRFFTLLRMPLKLAPIQVKWMAKYNFRLIDTGRLATFWVNGWDPKTYNENEEFKYFSTTKNEWNRHGMDGYR